MFSLIALAPGHCVPTVPGTEGVAQAGQSRSSVSVRGEEGHMSLPALWDGGILGSFLLS